MALIPIPTVHSPFSVPVLSQRTVGRLRQGWEGSANGLLWRHLLIQRALLLSLLERSILGKSVYHLGWRVLPQGLASVQQKDISCLSNRKEKTKFSLINRGYR